MDDKQIKSSLTFTSFALSLVGIPYVAISIIRLVSDIAGYSNPLTYSKSFTIVLILINILSFIIGYSSLKMKQEDSKKDNLIIFGIVISMISMLIHLIFVLFNELGLP